MGKGTIYMSNPIRLKSKNGIDANSITVINVADPVNLQDAMTKNYAVNNYQPITPELTAINALSGTSGLVAVTGTGTAASVTLTGTANQVTVTNGNGVGTPTIGLASNPVIPGTAAIQIPSGTTAQRPSSPVNGDMRFNTSTNAYEQYTNGSWKNIPTTTTPGAIQVRKTSAAFNTTTTYTTLIFDTVDVTSNSAICTYSTTTGLFTAVVAGYYTFDANISVIASNVNAVLNMRFYQNGTTVVNPVMPSRTASTTAQEEVNLCVLVLMNAGDTMALQLSDTTNVVAIQPTSTVVMQSLQGVQGANGPMGGSNNIFLSATALDSPNNSDWATYSGGVAPIYASTTNPALNVRVFDDSAIQCVGTTLYIPSTASNLTITITHNAATAPGSTAAVILQLYSRIVSNTLTPSAIGAWSSAYQLATVTVPTNIYFQTYSTTISLATLGITVGTTTQLELCRNGGAVGDTFLGNWQLLNITFSFT